jgi:hypothetical protein
MWLNAIRHFSRKRTRSGMRALARRAASVVHAFGRYNSKLSGHASCSPSNTLDTATWQLATLPSAPQYCRCTPTECVPCLGKLVSSRARTPRRVGTSSRSRRHSGSASHGESVMKCCSVWSLTGSLSRPCIACMDLRSLSLNSASRY